MRYQRKAYTAENYILMGYNSVADITCLSSLFCLAAVGVWAPKVAKSRKTPPTFDLTAVKIIQGHQSWCHWKAHM